MYFLCNRYKQHRDTKTEILIEQKPVVSDYHIFKNLIFAKRTLDPTEYMKYEEIYKILTKDMPVPNVIFYLHASLDTLVKRISQRGRDFEKNMDPVYLQQLAEDYETFITYFESAHPEIPVLRFNGDDLDFVNSEEDLQFILDTVDATIRKGARLNELTRKIRHPAKCCYYNCGDSWRWQVDDDVGACGCTPLTDLLPGRALQGTETNFRIWRRFYPRPFNL